MRRSFLLLLLVALGAMFTQGFQCSSSQLTVAKKAMDSKDFRKAKDALHTALSQNPNECTALAMLGDAHDSLNEQDSMLVAYRSALRCGTLPPRMRDAIIVSLYNKYANAYNTGILKYNDYSKNKSVASLKEARDRFQTAYTVRPEYTDPLMLLGEVYERLGDTVKAVETYTKWWNAEKSGFDAIASKNIALGAGRGSVIKTLGTPLATKSDSVEGGVLYRDAFEIGGKQIIMSSYADQGAEAMIEGWTYDAPPTLTDVEKWRSRMTSIQPLKNLAYITYNAANYSEAVHWSNMVLRAKPTDQELSSLRAQALQLSGKADEASNELAEQIKRDPSNVNARVQYATMLANADKYAEAIEQYKEIVRLDPTNEYALYDYGATCKNYASMKQRAELAKQDNDKKYKADTAVYFGLLKDAASAFEQLRKVSVRYRDDFVVIAEIANIYEVRQEPKKVAALIQELEALEPKYSTNKEYYRTMEGLYGRNKMIEKMNQANQKGSKL